MNRESADQVQRTPRDGLENQNAQVDDDDKDLPELNIEDQANETDPPIFTGRAWRKLKIILIGIGLVANIATRFALPTDHVKCIMDKTHEWLQPVNRFLHEHTDFAFDFKIFFNLLVDLNIVAAIVHWVFFCKRWGFFFDLTLFFVIRFVCTHLIAYRNAEGNLWPDNNFISISGTKMSEQQYQVSAYSGVLFICILYWSTQLKPKMKLVAIVSLITSIFVELSYRISYCTDIFAACLIAHLSHMLNSKFVPQFDDYVNSKLIRQWAIGKFNNQKEENSKSHREDAV